MLKLHPGWPDDVHRTIVDADREDRTRRRSISRSPDPGWKVAAQRTGREPGGLSDIVSREIACIAASASSVDLSRYFHRLA